MQPIDEFLKRIGVRNYSWCTLLDDWSSLVEDCECGYGWSGYELYNDSTARDYLERLLLESGLPDDVLQPIREAVSEVDQRYRSLLQPHVEWTKKSPYWWKRGVLKRAGRRYVESLRVRGIQVEEV
jgi:hypothetical protein